MRGCGVVAHVEDVRPVGVAVDYDEEFTPCIRAEVDCKFLKWSGWSWFRNKWLLGK